MPPTHSAVGSPLPEVDEPVVGCRTVQIVRKAVRDNVNDGLTPRAPPR